MSYETETKQETVCDIIVTDVKIFPFKCAGMNRIRALANIMLNDAIIIRGLRIMEGTNKPFLAYPAGPFSDGANYCSFIIPVTRKISEYIEDTVIKQYQKELANG